MSVQLQVVYRDMERSEALETHIAEKARKLEEVSDRISRCHVTVEQPHRHHNQGRRFSVRLDLIVPGAELVATREDSEDVYVALREAFDHARRQLEEHVRRQRGDVKHHEPTWRQKVRAGEAPSE